MPVSLDQALHTLARVHTREDSRTGFVIDQGAYPDQFNGVCTAAYVAAWKVVRAHLHLPVDPEVPK